MAQDVTGSISESTKTIYEDQIYVNDLYLNTDVDYYEIDRNLFDVPSAVNVTFDLDGEVASQNSFKISFISYDGTTETVLSTVSTASGKELQFSAPDPGKRYFLRIEKDEGYSKLDYKLSASVIATAESELSSGQNNTIIQSDPILGASTYYGTLNTDDDDLSENEGGDWYYFTTGDADSGTISLKLSAFTQDEAATSLYSVRVTDANKTTVRVNNALLEKTASTSNDALFTFSVGELPAGAGTYFVHVTAVDADQFAASTEYGQNYSLTLAGTSAFNTTPVVEVADLTSGAYATKTVDPDDGFIGFGVLSTTALSEFISASDGEGEISAYLIRLEVSGDAASTPARIIYDDEGTGDGSIVAKTSDETGFVSLSATQFASAKYVAADGSETQNLQILVRDEAGVSSVDVDSSSSEAFLQKLSDTSGAVQATLKTANAKINITADEGNPEFLTEGSDDEMVFSVALEGDLSGQSATVVISTTEDVIIKNASDHGESHVATKSVNENEYILAFSAEETKSFTVIAPSVADNDGMSEEVTLDYKVVSDNSLFDGLKLESSNLTVKENVATITPGSVTYKYTEIEYVEEGNSDASASYTVSAEGIADGQTLTLLLSGDDFDFDSESHALTSENSSVTVTVTAAENTDEDGDADTALFDAVITHTILENGVSLGYDVPDVTVAIKDNDVNFAPVVKNEDLTDPAIQGVKSITIASNLLLENDEDPNGDTLTITAATLVSAVTTIDGQATDVPGTINGTTGNVIFTPTDPEFAGVVTLTFGYRVSDGSLFSDGEATVALDFIAGTPVNMAETDTPGQYSSTADVEIITGRSELPDEFIFEKPSSGGLGDDTIINFEAGVDTLSLAGYSSGDYTIRTDTLGNSLVTMTGEDTTITLEAANSAAILSYKQLLNGSVVHYMGGDEVGTIAISSGTANGSDITNFDSVRISGVTDFSEHVKVRGDNEASNPINLSDVLAQLKHIIGLKELKSNALYAADTNNDGNVNLSDVLENLKHIIGLKTIDTFDVVTEHALVTDSLTSSSNGELNLVINGDADQSHADWDLA